MAIHILVAKSQIYAKMVTVLRDGSRAGDSELRKLSDLLSTLHQEATS